MTRLPLFARKATSRPRTALSPRAESLEGRQLLSAGDLDVSFGNGGFVLTSPRLDPKNGAEAYPDDASVVRIQLDSSILVAGRSQYDFGLVRLTPDGVKDLSFGSGGGVVTDFFGQGQVDQASDLAVQPVDGKIILVGPVGAGVFTNRTAVYNVDFGIARYLPNGSLDSSFGPNGNGKVNTNISTYQSSDTYNKWDNPSAVALQADGKIVVGGYMRSGPAANAFDAVLARYDDAGNLDPSFGQGGKVTTPLSPGYDAIGDLEILPDGKILVVGAMDDASGQRSIFAARYDASGNLDPSFGTVGVAIAPVAPRSPAGGSMALQADGGIVVSVSSKNGANNDFSLVRFTTGGGLDATFGASGIVTVDLGGDESSGGVAVQGDDKIIEAGTASNDSFVARFQPDGTFDSSFGIGGLVIRSFSSGLWDGFNDLTLQADGRIVAVDTATSIRGHVSELDFLVARFLGDSGTSAAASSLSPQVSSTATVSPNPTLAAPLVTINDDLTQLATECLRSTPKRTRHDLRSSYLLGTI